MGFADVTNTYGGGRYAVTMRRDKDTIEAKVAYLNKKILTCPLDELPVYQKRRDKLQVLLTNDPIDAWCCDYTTTMATSVVETVEVNGEPTDIIIRPYTPGHHQNTIRDLTPLVSQSAAQAYFNFVVHQGWQKWLPTYRIGTITSIDYAAHTCNITLDAAVSHWGYGNSNINQSTILTGVPIAYMTCNSIAFAVDDRVVVEFIDQDQDNPQVIGFETNPQQCTGILLAVFASYDGTEAFAWDLYNNSVFLENTSLSSLTTTLSCLGYGGLTMATVSGAAAEVWTIATPVSDFYQGSYSQATFLEGTYVGLATAGWDLSVSRPMDAQLAYVTGGHEWSWDYKYCTAPQFVQDVVVDSTEYQKGGHAINLKLFPDANDAAQIATFESLTGMGWFGNTFINPWPNSCVPTCPFGPERTYFFYHSIFDMQPGWAIKETLDNTCTQLLDSWADVTKGGFMPGGDAYDCTNTMGIAENSDCVVVFDFAQACDDVDAINNDCNDLDMDSRRIFRVYAHQKNCLTGLGLEIFDEINDYRVANGKKPLVENMGLLKAARRHALDCAANDSTSHIGSDASTTDSRIEDTDYKLWLDLVVMSVSTDEFIEEGAGLNPVNLVADWQLTPAKDATMLDSGITDCGAFSTTGDNGHDYLVVVFAGIANLLGTGARWPGFCPVTTGDIDANFIDYGQ